MGEFKGLLHNKRAVIVLDIYRKIGSNCSHTFCSCGRHTLNSDSSEMKAISVATQYRGGEDAATARAFILTAGPRRTSGGARPPRRPLDAGGSSVAAAGCCRRAICGSGEISAKCLLYSRASPAPFPFLSSPFRQCFARVRSQPLEPCRAARAAGCPSCLSRSSGGGSGAARSRG